MRRVSAVFGVLLLVLVLSLSLWSAPSTLADSLQGDPRIANNPRFIQLGANAWIKEHCHRANLLMDHKHGPHLLSLLEVLLHARLMPRYEG